MMAPPPVGPLTFPEEILILLLNDAQETLTPIPRTKIDCALAGAVLMDLAFAGRIDTDLETLYVADHTPMGNILLDSVLAKITAREETTDTSAWLKTLAADDAGRIREQALWLLVRRGMLQRRAGSFNAVFAVWPETLPRRRRGFAGSRGARGRRQGERPIGQRVREALLSDGIPEPRDTALIGLVAASNLLREAVPDGKIDRLRSRVARLCQLDLIGRELVRVVSEIERSVVQALAAGASPPGPAVRIE